MNNASCGRVMIGHVEKDSFREDKNMMVNSVIRLAIFCLRCSLTISLGVVCMCGRCFVALLSSSWILTNF